MKRCLELFVTMLKIGLFPFGGGCATISPIRGKSTFSPILLILLSAGPGMVFYSF